jgi:hypothetical protein
VKLTKPGLRELLYWTGLPLEDCSVNMVKPQGIKFLYTDAS